MKNINFKIVFSSIIFSIGYLFTLINSYYHYNHKEFIEINREDLISRLPFMSSTTGFLFYPLVVLLLILLCLIFKNKTFSFKSLFLSSMIGVFVIGVLFYIEILGNLVFGNNLSIIIGIIMLLFSFYTYYRITKPILV